MRRPLTFVDDYKGNGISPPSRKRRRTIVDAFGEISLEKEIQPSAEWIEEDNNSMHSSEIRMRDKDMTMATDPISNYTSDDHIDDDEEQERPLSAKEIAEREIMRQIVFGATSTERRTDPVDRRLQELIRESFKQDIKPDTMMCDMNVETSYNRPSPSMVVEGEGRPRSNSLPDGDDFAGMDLDPL